MKCPHPRQFNDFETYEAALVGFYADALPKVSNFDNDEQAAVKRRNIYAAQDDARELAFERWDAWLDVCADAYERGVGPAWD